MKILFMGTPDFAAESLKRIYEDGHELCGVFTQPDKPKDRGMKTSFSPVKELALKIGVPVFQPRTLRDGKAEDIIRELSPDAAVIVAYGKLIPKSIIEIPKKGCVNLHGSLLPKYRGSAPIQWSILNGDKVTGVTTIYINEEMDAGDIIESRSVEIGEYETSGELFERLKREGAELLSHTLLAIEKGTARRTKQNETEAVFTRLLSKSDSPIDWCRSANEVINQIRGLNPWPSATAVLGGTMLKIHSARQTVNKTDKPAGEIVSTGKDGIEVACGDGGTVLITELQAPGKKRASAYDYLLGHKL